MKTIIGADVAAAKPESAVAPGHAPRQVTYLQVDDESAGQRLDNFLVRCLKGVPRTHIHRIIRSGEVRVNKGRAEAQTRVQQGDLVRLPPVRDSERARQKAERLAVARSAATGRSPATEFACELPVLYEDELFLAIDKPAGLAVHGGSGISFGVIERMRASRSQARFLELVHRLDRETSGVLLVAKKRSALKALQLQFRERGTGKSYLAMVKGEWPASKKLIDLPLLKYLIDGPLVEERRVKVVREGERDALSAVTMVKVARRLDGFTLLEVTIKTGRTHQIRVHLAHAGHPIVGDDKYGDFELNRRLAKSVAGAPLRRMFLHAWRLGLDHPATGERLTIESPLPAELQSWIGQLVPADSRGKLTVRHASPL